MYCAQGIPPGSWDLRSRPLPRWAPSLRAFRWHNVRQLERNQQDCPKARLGYGRRAGRLSAADDRRRLHPLRDLWFAQAGRPRSDLHRCEGLSPVNRQHRRERRDPARSHARGPGVHRPRRAAAPSWPRPYPGPVMPAPAGRSRFAPMPASTAMSSQPPAADRGPPGSR